MSILSRLLFACFGAVAVAVLMLANLEPMGYPQKLLAYSLVPAAMFMFAAAIGGARATPVATLSLGIFFAMISGAMYASTHAIFYAVIGTVSTCLMIASATTSIAALVPKRIPR